MKFGQAIMTQMYIWQELKLESCDGRRNPSVNVAIFA